jgi:hydrogenase expression/formation protein HypC
MCLGIPARIITIGDRHSDVANVDMAGVRRDVNIALLDGPTPIAEGDWILVHMGFALQQITAEEAADAIQALDAERQAEREALTTLYGERAEQ